MRLFVGLDHSTVESGLYFVPLSEELALREVILGPRCELPLQSIQELVSSYPSSVEVTKARVAFKSFSVVKDRLVSSGSDGT